MILDVFSLNSALSYLGCEERATLAGVCRSFNQAVKRCMERDRRLARSLALERTIGAPGTSPFGFGMVHRKNGIESVCVVYRKQKAWYNAGSGTEVTRDNFRAYPLHVRAVGVGDMAKCLAVMFNDSQGEAIVCDAATGCIIQKFLLRELRGLCWPIALSPCGRWLAFPFRNSVVNIGNLATGKFVALDAPADFRPRGAGFSRDGKQILISGILSTSAVKRITLSLYDITTQELILDMVFDGGHQLPCREGFIEFSPSGRLVVLPTRTSIAIVNIFQKRIVYMLRTRSLHSHDIKTNPHHLKPFDNQFATFSANGSWVVTTREKRGWLQIWDLTTGQELFAINGGHYWAWPLASGGLLTCLRSANGWQMALLKSKRLPTKRKTLHSNKNY